MFTDSTSSEISARKSSPSPISGSRNASHEPARASPDSRHSTPVTTVAILAGRPASRSSLNAEPPAPSSSPATTIASTPAARLSPFARMNAARIAVSTAIATTMPSTMRSRLTRSWL